VARAKGAAPSLRLDRDRRVVEARHLHADYWGRNAKEPVAFAAAIDTLVGSEHTIFLEIGPQPVVTRYVRESLSAARHDGIAIASTARGRPEVDGFFDALAELYARGVVGNIAGLHGERAACVDLPLYPFDDARYWFEPARRRRHASPRHTLVGEPFALEHTPDTHVWTSDLDPVRLAYLSDHRVGGLTIMPGTAYVEIGIAAARAVFPDRAFSLADVEFREILSIPEDLSIRLQTSARPTARAASH